MFPYTVCEFSHAWALFLGDAIVRVGTREADERRVVEPDGGLAILVRAVEGRQEDGGRGPAGACSSSRAEVRDEERVPRRRDRGCSHHRGRRETIAVTADALSYTNRSRRRS